MDYKKVKPTDIAEFLASKGYTIKLLFIKPNNTDRSELTIHDPNGCNTAYESYLSLLPLVDHDIDRIGEVEQEFENFIQSNDWHKNNL
jgi:hypothetical protein